jgi:YHS domain-containing protein
MALALIFTPILAAADNEAPAKKAAKPYPLTTCLVSGEDLGEMGEPYVVDHEGQEIKFCCKDCAKSFNKDPDKYLKKLAESAKAPDEHAGHAHH